jgi:hypothetical protein
MRQKLQAVIASADSPANGVIEVSGRIATLEDDRLSLRVCTGVIGAWET